MRKIIDFITNGTGTIGYPHAKDWHWTPTLHYLQKLIQIYQTFKIKTIKPFKDHIEVNFCDSGLGKEFLEQQKHDP